MSLITIIFIAFALSLDSFAVSVASGIVIREKKNYHALRFGLSFGLFQMFMPVLGWLAGQRFFHLICDIDHWLAFGLLSAIGVKMIYEAMQIKSLEESQKEVTFQVLMGLAVATSIDALVVGLSLSFLNVPIIEPVIVIGIITFLMSYSGFFIGHKFGHIFEQKVEIVAGLILIGIGLKIVIQHLFF